MKPTIDITYSDDNIFFNYLKTEKINLRSFPYEPHEHNICELIFLKRGNAKYFVEGRDYKLAKNTLVLTRPGDRHMIHFDEEGPYERYDLFFDEKNVPPDLYKKIPPKLDIVNFDGNVMVCDLFKRSSYYCEHFGGELLSRVLCSFAEEIFYNIAIALEEMSDDDQCSASINPLVTSALSYIEENLTANITINDICDKLFITNSHLHHLFMNHLQISPKRYILSKRLNLARRGIRSGQKPIEACMQSGFCDYSTFYRDYKKTFGHSPSQELDFVCEKNITRS